MDDDILLLRYLSKRQRSSTCLESGYIFNDEYDCKIEKEKELEI